MARRGDRAGVRCVFFVLGSDFGEHYAVVTSFPKGVSGSRSCGGDVGGDGPNYLSGLQQTLIP